MGMKAIKVVGKYHQLGGREAAWKWWREYVKHIYRFVNMVMMAASWPFVVGFTSNFNWRSQD